MQRDPSPQCPFSGGEPMVPTSSEGHEMRWDLHEHRDLLLPPLGAEVADLESSAKEAWRNSTRCIGRRLWKALKVVDARTLSEPDDLFEAMIAHLREATNGGMITPVMTIFREWLPDEPEIRIWNHQFIRYAGYQLNGHSILGDPMNLELTNLARSLGWKPPSEPSAFDLLPIIIQSGERLRYYELPREEVLEVRIRHPKYPSLEKLDLRWHAVPVVSDMIFATGSGLFPCAPFSGHYLGTEIGARNLADTDRYNLLPNVAALLGLETTHRRSLWKDHALVVLNEAVLWSFDHEGVRIADHHGASDDFLKFCQQEEKEGRKAHAEWSWVVPPISGSATSVFHQLYEKKSIYPNFLHQVPAWQTPRGKELLASREIKGS